MGQNNETFFNPIHNLGINQIRWQLDKDEDPQDTKQAQRLNINYYEDETNQNQAASNQNF